MYGDRMTKEEFLSFYCSEYEEISEAWERYSDIFPYLDNTDNLPEDLDDLSDWICTEISSYAIDIVGRGVFSEDFDKISDYIWDSTAGIGWSACSFDRNNAICIDIDECINTIIEIAKEHDIELEIPEYDKYKILYDLNVETNFKFV